MSINIVLFEPEIPQNTGNIARSCAATGSKLHLIKPLGFSISDKQLKRAGLDYWNLVDISYYDNLDEFLNIYGNKQIFLSTTKARRFYSEVQYLDDCFIVFGKETKGLPENLHELYHENRIKIPMIANEHARSLNLSNSVNIVLYEALRQNKFFDMI
jgi:tRNA (cytidine/uridine-2'-O-)-methyltransferase